MSTHLPGFSHFSGLLHIQVNNGILKLLHIQTSNNKSNGSDCMKKYFQPIIPSHIQFEFPFLKGTFRLRGL